MKNYSNVEFWFAVVLCVAVLGETYPMVQLGEEVFAASDDGILIWFEFIASALLFFTAMSCVFWEWVLLLMRRSDSAASTITPTVAFCGGLISVLLNIVLFSSHG